MHTTQHHQRAESDIKGLGRHSSGDRHGTGPPHSALIFCIHSSRLTPARPAAHASGFTHRLAQ
eukprot:scaffold80584_cov69-Phaeocystis_antarctica.AAC.1